jgi:endoglucanase
MSPIPVIAGALCFSALCASDARPADTGVGVRDTYLRGLGETDIWSAAEAVGVHRLEVAVDQDLACPGLFEGAARPYRIDTPENRLAFKKAFREHRMVPSCLCAGIRGEDGPADDSVPWMERVLEAAAALDIAIVMVPLGYGARSDEDFVRRSIALIQALAPIAERTGRTIAIENLGLYLNRREVLSPILRAMPGKNVGLAHDVANMYWFGHPLESVYELAREVAPYVRYVHVKNIRYPEAMKGIRRTPGWEYAKHAESVRSGDIDFKRVIAAYAAAGFRGDLTIEDDSLGGRDAAGKRAVLIDDAELLRAIAASADAPGPAGQEAGRIVQGPFLLFGDEKGGLHLMKGSEIIIRGIGVFCGADQGGGRWGYWPYDRMAETKATVGKGTLGFSGKVPGMKIAYDQTVSIDGDRIKFRIHRTGAWTKGWEGFYIRLPLEYYAAAPCRVDGQAKSFPAKYTPANRYPIQNAKKLECHLGDTSLDLTFECAEGITLSDEREFGTRNYVVSVGVPREVQEGSVELFLTLPRLPAAAGSAVRSSRIGYPVDGPKYVVLEWPQHCPRPDDDAVRLEKADGSKVKEGKFGATVTLQHMQSDFAAFDFSEVKEPGDYRIVHAGSKTDVRIRENVFEDKLWEPTLDCFIPFQMCHADVDLGGASPDHTRCHMDDGIRVPANFPGVDRFRSYECEGTPYEAGDRIPCAKGGWHDAGDCDLNIYAQGFTVWVLALAREEFGIDRDVSTLDVERGKFTLGKPDGVPDILQQIEWGAIWLLGMLQPDGRSYVGVIDQPDRYSQADKKWSEMTDNVPGTGDERQVYVDYHSELQLMQATALSAASRALRGRNPDLARKCLDGATGALKYFRTHKEVYRSTVYFYPEHRKGRDGMVALTLAELYLTARDEAYRKDLEGMAETIRKLSVSDPEASTASSFWYAPPVLARLHAVLPDGELKSAIVEVCRRAAEAQAHSESPRPWPFHYWHFGNWGQAATGATRTFDAYYLSKVVPDGFPVRACLRSMLWIYGLHPLNDKVFVSGIGFPGPEFIHSGQIFGLFHGEPGTVPGALIGGLTGINAWKPSNVLFYRDDGNAGNNEVGISSSPVYLFAVNALKKAGF